MHELGIFDEWAVNSLNKDRNGMEFISTMEHKKYPFFGVQFHPEKNIYEWKIKKGILHSVDTVKTSQYFANMFVDQARYNQHGYSDWKELQKELIWNYRVVHTGLIPGSNYEQCYFFKDDETKDADKHIKDIMYEVSYIN